MLSFGWSEIIITFIVLIIVIGPKEIPNLIKNLNKFSQVLRKSSRQFKESLSDLADDNSINEIKNSLNDVSKIKNDLNPMSHISDEINSIKETIDFSDKEIKSINSKINKKINYYE